MDYKIIVCLEVCGVLKKTFSYRVQTIIIIVTSKIVFVFFDNVAFPVQNIFALNGNPKKFEFRLTNFEYTYIQRNADIHSFVLIA